MRLEQWLYAAPLRLRSLLRRDRVEQELEDELRFHLEQQTEEYMARGFAPEEARRAALGGMHGLAQRKEECRDARGVTAIENTVRDIRYAVRVLCKSRTFTIAAVITLALAISANAVVFGLLDSIILRPLDLPRVESLYGVQRGNEASSFQSYPDYLDLRDRNQSFEQLAAYNIAQAGFDAGDAAKASWGYAVSGNYFEALGIEPYLGRFFTPADEHGANSAPYIVITYDYWHSRFLNDRGVIGRTVRINKHPFTVVAVTQPGFHGTLLFGFPDFFIPLVDEEQVQNASIVGTNLLGDRRNRWVFMALGHLKPGVSPAQAAADLNRVGSYLERTYPKDDDQRTFALARPSQIGRAHV